MRKGEPRRSARRTVREDGEEDEERARGWPRGLEAMVLGDLMRTAGGGGFPKQLAAISTDPIKINERAACESKRSLCAAQAALLLSRFGSAGSLSLPSSAVLLLFVQLPPAVYLSHSVALGSAGSPFHSDSFS